MYDSQLNYKTNLKEKLAILPICFSPIKFLNPSQMVMVFVDGRPWAFTRDMSGDPNM